MSKKNLEELKRDDPKENNWEIEEAASSQQSAVSDPIQIPHEMDQEFTEKIDAALKQQDQEFAALKQQRYPEELKDIFSLLPKNILEIERMKKKIYEAWLKVDPEISAQNPVWKYFVKDEKHFVFIFRTGQKVRIEL